MRGRKGGGPVKNNAIPDVTLLTVHKPHQSCTTNETMIVNVVAPARQHHLVGLTRRSYIWVWAMRRAVVEGSGLILTTWGFLTRIYECILPAVNGGVYIPSARMPVRVTPVYSNVLLNSAVPTSPSYARNAFSQP